MGWYALIACGAAAWLLKGTGLFPFAVINAIANFWSFGVMHNFTYNPQSAPNSWAVVNMLSTLIGIILLIYAFIA